MHKETKPSPNIYRTIRESFERIDPEFSGEKRMSLDLKRMEMFICDPVEFLNVKAFNRVKKRYVLLPFSVHLSNKTKIKHDEEKDEFLVITKHNVVIEKLVLEIYYADILFVDENIKYQMAQIREEGGFHRQSKKEKKIEKIKDESVQEFDIDSKGVQIVLVDNSEGFLAPALKLGIYDLQVSVAVTMPNKVLLQGKTLLDGCFYNSLPCKWEPFLEKAGFRFECLAEENHKIHVELQNSEDTQTINLNVCDQLLDIAQHLAKTWYVVGSTKRQKKKFDFNKSRIYRAMSKSLNKEEYAIDYISPYTIVNSTGFPIEVETIYTSAPEKSSTTARNPNLMKDTYHIQNGGATQFLVESERDGVSESLVNSRSINANKIMVRILHPTVKLDDINGINIDKPRIRGYPITTTDTGSGQTVPLGDCYLHSVVEITRGKKIITLTSSMHITNKLWEPCTLVFEVFDQLLEVRLEPNETVAVPINYIPQGTFLIKSGEEQRSQKVGFQTLLITQGQMAEFGTGDSFVVAKAFKAQEKCNFYEILLLPPLELKNCCKLRLFYRLFEDERDVYEENRSLNSEEIVQENNLSIRSPVYFQVRLQGYNWSDKIRIPESLSDSDRIEKIYMTDSQRTSFHLSMLVPKGGAGVRKVIFFAETRIINETPYELCYGQGGSKSEKFTLPGQTPIDPREPFDSKVLLYDKIDNMVICRPSYLEQSNPFGVKTLGSRAVEMPNKTNTAMLELGVNTSMVTVDKDYNVMTKVITVSPRYVFLNSTPYKMEVKSSAGGEKPLMMIDKEGRCPLYWQEWTPGNKE